MARGPATNPIAPRVKRKPRCVVCGFEITRPRAFKRCSRCKEELPITSFGHALRSDHRESYCGLPTIGGNGCKAAIQRESKGRVRGKAQPLSSLSPFGEQALALVGQYASQAPFSEYRDDVASSIGAVLVQYRTVDRNLVYELVIAPAARPTGTDRDHIKIAHTFKELFDAPLKKGQWIACILDHGELSKMVVEGDKYPLIDTSLDIAEDEDSPLGFRFRSYAPARPWSLRLALEYVTGSGPTGDGCPICGNELGKVEDFTLCCPTCTGSVRHSAEVILVDHSAIDPELAFAVLSRLETDWLLSQIPKEVEVPA